MRIEPTAIPGAYQVFLEIKKDERGSFVKTFREDVFRAHGLATQFAEEYYSVSRKGVLRGMHFQTPPHQHTKLVHCLSGRVFDVVVDLRVDSPTFGQALSFELSADAGNLLYLPPGIAHGFYAMTDQAIMQYKVTSAYDPLHDQGVRWDSIGMAWPDSAPQISVRDSGFAAMGDFASPFQFVQPVPFNG